MPRTGETLTLAGWGYGKNNRGSGISSPELLSVEETCQQRPSPAFEQAAVIDTVLCQRFGGGAEQRVSGN